MSTINELLRLFITYESRGSDQIYREWKDLEKQGARVEENLGGVEKKFDDIGDASEANAKKSESSLQKMGKAIGGVQKQHEDLARSQDTVRRSTEGLADAFGDLSKRSTAELKQIQASLKTLGDDQAAMRIGAEIDNRSFGVAKARIDAFKAGVAADDTHVEVKADYDSASFHGVEQGIQGVVSSIREVRTLAMGFSIVGIIAALGGAIPLAISLTGALARLATGIGAGLAGAAAIGGAAVAGAVGGLRAYGAGIAYVVSQAGQLPTNVASATSALSSATSAFQSAKDAVNSAKKGTDEYAQAQLQLQSATLQLQQAQTEYQRMQILNTAAARGFAAETQDSSIQLAKLQAAVGNNVFPYFTRELDYWNEEIGTFTPRIAATSGALAAVAAKFSEFIRTSRQGKTLTLFFNFLSRSALRAENAIFGLGVGATRILEYLIPPAARLQNSVVRLSMAFAAWAQSAKGTQQIAAAIGFLERRMYQVITIATDLGRAIFNIFAAVNRSTNMENILNPLVFGMRDFADATDKGSVGAQKITAFMNAAKPALQAVASLALEAARQILILADNVIRAGQSGGKIGTLAQVINSVKASLAPIRVLLQNTFIQLGPALAKLIPEVVKFASAFLGSSNVLVAFVNRITGLLHLFNSLPPGVKSVVIEMVALNSIMSGLGGPTSWGCSAP